VALRCAQLLAGKEQPSREKEDREQTDNSKSNLKAQSLIAWVAASDVRPEIPIERSVSKMVRIIVPMTGVAFEKSKGTRLLR
jgi:hypothetical protein